MKEIKGAGSLNCFRDKVVRANTDFTGTSSQMEYFNLHRALKMICLNLEKSNEKNLLNIVINGGLEALKILLECNQVFKIYLDLNHKVKTSTRIAPSFFPTTLLKSSSTCGITSGTLFLLQATY